MQLSLWGILGITLLLAQWLHRHYRHLQHVSLEEVQDFGGMQLRPPAGWDRQILAGRITFTESADVGGGRRTLTVWRSNTPIFLSPVEFLLRSGQVSLIASRPEPPGNIDIAGWPGVLITEVYPPTAQRPRQPSRSKRLIACTVLPSLAVIGLELSGEGDPSSDSADGDLIRRVAQSISLPQPESPRYTSRVDLPEGIQVAVPDGFATPDSVPPLRDSRTLVLMHGSVRLSETARKPCTLPSGAWLAVDLVPCVFLPGDNPGTFVAMLMRRDPKFLPAPVVTVKEQILRCERRDDAVLPSVAYLRVGPDGRALLAEFRWSRPGSSAAEDVKWVDGFWQHISRGIQFGKLPTTMPSRVSAGAKAVAQLPEDPAKLLSDDDSAGFQWYHESLATVNSLTKARYLQSGQVLRGQIEATRLPPLPNPVREEWCTWSLWNPASRLKYDYTLKQGDFTQETHIADGGYEITIAEDGRPLAQSTGKVPAGFIPGGVLPLALGRLPQEPMVLTTDAVPIAGVTASTTLLRLLVEPANDPPSPTTEPLQPMRFWRVRINGASSSSRWCFDKDGRLHTISFDGQVHLIRTEPEPAQTPETRPAEE